MMGQIMDEFIARPFSLLLGRKTYDIFASYWPNQEGPTADKFNPAKKYVVSHTLNKPSWNNSVLIKDNAAKEIEKIKNDDPNELHVYGSGSLVKTLVNNNLVDLFQVWIFPVTVGKGKQLFGEGTNAFSFRLIDVKSTGSGVIIAFYEPSGNLRTGNVGPE
jgi:dihydrofolate reductase